MRTWLRDLRYQRGMTQGEVAARARISRVYYVQIENESGCPSLSPYTAMKLGETLGFDWPRFFEEDRARKSNIYRQDEIAK